MLFIPLKNVKFNRDSARNDRGVFFIDGAQSLEPLCKSWRDETLKFSRSFILLFKVAF